MWHRKAALRGEVNGTTMSVRLRATPLPYGFRRLGTCLVSGP